MRSSVGSLVPWYVCSSMLIQTNKQKNISRKKEQPKEGHYILLLFLPEAAALNVGCTGNHYQVTDREACSRDSTIYK